MTETGLMKSNTLFKGVVFKRLSAVEADTARSNQHEFNGTRPLIELFGRDQPKRIEAKFILVPDSGDIVHTEGQVTWYDARARHPTRTEFRLYYHDNEVVRLARPDDTLIVGRKWDDTIFVLVTSGLGNSAAYIFWLFGIEVEPGAAFVAISSFDGARFLLDKVSDIPIDNGWYADNFPSKIESDADLGPIKQLQKLLGVGRSGGGTDNQGENTWCIEDI